MKTSRNMTALAISLQRQTGVLCWCNVLAALLRLWSLVHMHSEWTRKVRARERKTKFAATEQIDRCWNHLKTCSAVRWRTALAPSMLNQWIYGQEFCDPACFGTRCQWRVGSEAGWPAQAWERYMNVAWRSSASIHAGDSTPSALAMCGDNKKRPGRL